MLDAAIILIFLYPFCGWLFCVSLKEKSSEKALLTIIQFVRHATRLLYIGRGWKEIKCEKIRVGDPLRCVTQNYVEPKNQPPRAILASQSAADDSKWTSHYTREGGSSPLHLGRPLHSTAMPCRVYNLEGVRLRWHNKWLLCVVNLERSKPLKISSAIWFPHCVWGQMKDSVLKGQETSGKDFVGCAVSWFGITKIFRRISISFSSCPRHAVHAVAFEWAT